METEPKIATWCTSAAAAAAAEELLADYMYGLKKGRDANIHQPSPHTKITGVSNNTKGLFFFYTEQNK